MKFDQDNIVKYELVMKMYEKFYDFHFCREDEIEDVVKFIDHYWKKGHILVLSKKLMKWQYWDDTNQRYNFVLARSKKNGEIHALIGFIMTSQYDPDIKTPMRWGAIWKMRDDVGAKGLGMCVKYYFTIYAPAPYIGGIGLSNDSKNIDTKLGEHMGTLIHYYMLNRKRTSFRLVNNVDDTCFPNIWGETGKTKFIALSENAFMDFYSGLNVKDLVPYKSSRYYIKRYFHHPMYSYSFYAILINDEVSGGFFWRIASAEGEKCIVIVDYVGADYGLKGAYQEFQEMMDVNRVEYISFLEHGLDDDVLSSAGFLICTEENPIVPVYYEPFSRINVTLDYHYFSEEGYPCCDRIFKGDADQDRPNIMR